MRFSRCPLFDADRQKSLALFQCAPYEAARKSSKGDSKQRELAPRTSSSTYCLVNYAEGSENE